jgi:hypothetical protein
MYIIYLHSPRHNIAENKQQSKNKNVAHIFSILFSFLFFNFCLSCARCCLYLSVAHSWLLFRFPVTFINTGNHKQCNVIVILCLRIYFYIVTCQWLMAGRLFSPGTPVSSTNQTDRYDITEILLKVGFNTITSNNQWYFRHSHVINMIYFLGLDPTGPLFYKFDPAVRIDSQEWHVVRIQIMSNCRVGPHQMSSWIR